MNRKKAPEEKPLAVVSRLAGDPEGRVYVKWYHGASARLRRQLLQGPYCSECEAYLTSALIVCPHPVWRDHPEPPEDRTKYRPSSDFDFVPSNKELAKNLDMAEHFARQADEALARLTGGDGETSGYYAMMSIAHVRASLAEINRQAKIYRTKLQKDIGGMPPWLQP